MSNINKKLMNKINSKKYTLMIFLIACSFYFSNVFEEGVKIFYGMTIGNLLSIIASLVSLLFFKMQTVFKIIVFMAIILISTALNIGDGDYWIKFIYKTMTFFPLFVILESQRYKNIDNLMGVEAAFWLSIVISIILIFLDQYSARYILYAGSPPRYAALTHEPSGFALGVFAYYVIHIIYRGKINATKFYFFIAIAQSSVMVALIVVDILRRKRVLLYLLSIALIPLMISETRILESIVVRIDLYIKELSIIEINFFGAGIYNADTGALMGFFRVLIEGGVIFFVFLIGFLIALALKLILMGRVHLAVAIFLPLITEVHGAVLLWMVPILIFGISGGLGLKRSNWLNL